MNQSNEEERISHIFSDLQKDRQNNGIIINLISKSRKLISDKKIGNFQGDKSKNEIRYDPDFFRDTVSKYNDNLIRFILLHEEAHIFSSKNHTKELFYVFIRIVSLFTIILYFNLLSIGIIFHESTFKIPSMISSIVFFIFCLMVGIPAIWRYQWDVMFEDELTADYYGAKCLSEYFNDLDPSKTVGPYFMEKNSFKEEERITRKKRMMKLWGVYPDYHPSNYERLAKISENFPPSTE